MRLRVIQEGIWTICSPILGNDDFSAFELFMDEVEDNYAASLAGMAALMEQHAQKGRTALNTSQCHYVDQGEQIYQYIKGRLRVFWFEDGDHVVVCTHGIIKKTQKTPRREIKKAINIKHLYQASKRNLETEFVDED